MIQLKKLFTPVDSMEADEAKAYIAGHREGDYTILDVRQPWEYEESHLPGGKLIPLSELPGAYREMDPEKPTIVHCASGRRSQVAAQLLSGLGFKEVYNLAGGIKAYQGQKATGARELNLDLVRGDETPPEILKLAYGMEQFLQLFYQTMLKKSQDRESLELFKNLARVEERHKQRLAQEYARVAPGDQDLSSLESSTVPTIMEGGFNLKEFMEANAPHLKKAPDVLEMAMMLETQALDLYLRFAQRCTQPPTRQVLFTIAEEEKAHLARLGRLLEAKLQEQG
jgi:rhodanese-related sulfurtransferase/rubrerythrin